MMNTNATGDYTVCPCCDGAGIQTRNDGIKVRCPGCNEDAYYAAPVLPMPWSSPPMWPDPYPATCTVAQSDGIVFMRI